MIKYYKRSLKNNVIKELNTFQKGCWINVIKPTEKEIKYLIKKFKLEEHNIISGLDDHELPRFEIEDGIKYIITKTIDDTEEFNQNTLLIAISNKFILTLSKKENEFIKQIFKQKIEFYTTQKLKSMIKILEFITNKFEKSTLEIVKKVNQQKRTSKQLKERDVHELLNYEEQLNNLVSTYNHTNLLFHRILRKLDFYEEDEEIIEDLIIELNQGLDLCKSSLKTIKNLRDHYSIFISDKLNKIITFLTIITLFISIPAAISGIYGMNVKLPFQENINIFYFIITLIVIIWIISFIYFKKKEII